MEAPMCNGISVSPGLVMAEARLIRTDPVEIDRTPVAVEQVEQECARFQRAAREAVVQLTAIITRVTSSVGPDKAAIFEGQQVLVEDAELVHSVLAEIREHRLSAPAAVHKVLEEHAVTLEAFDDAYQRARAVDIRDLLERLVGNCQGTGSAGLGVLEGEGILVAGELSPSRMAMLDVTKVKGVITECGNSTSHTAIMAAAMGIPAIVGVNDATRLIHEGDLIILDAEENVIRINPSREQRRYFKVRAEAYLQSGIVLDALRDLSAATTDGVRITLAANIGSPADISSALKQGAQGVGLFRVEFLFMGQSHPPGEEEQYQAFKTVVEGMEGAPVVIRILDVGGDKDLPYLNLPREHNPFLGCRGIRLCFARPDLLQTQLRALLRAGVHGDVRILVPMIASVEEVRTFKTFLNRARQSLERDGILHPETMPLGVMIETPSSVYLAPHLAREVDFFSMGTNDLTQYTLAVDRTSDDLADMYDPLSPAVLLSIQHTVDAARMQDKPVCVCGQMAGDVPSALLLIGMGVEELSMSPVHIPRVKQAIRTHRHADLREMARKILTLATVEEVRERLFM
jgi:phosphotransferase system enzyme I (PtsI)